MESLATDIQKPRQGEYALGSGEGAVGRLLALHEIYGPAGRRLLENAGLRPGMRVADFGCGVGAVTRMLAEMTGPTGSVTGIDASSAQIDQAAKICDAAGLQNVAFRTADACNTGLPRAAFDLVYCRLLLMHLTDPAACLHEMRDVLKPGGILVIEDADLASANSVPLTALDNFADLFSRLAPTRGVDYSIGNRLIYLAKAAGFENPQTESHQPAGQQSRLGALLTWSVAEAGPAFVSAGLITARQLKRTVEEMDRAAQDPEVLVFCPRMSGLWARKAA